MGTRRDILMKDITDRAIKYIKENYHHEDISLKKVSREVCLSHYYFSHVFKEYCKISFIEYLTKVRLQEAAKLLKNPRLNIDQIAFAVGYQDPGYFSKVFKRAYKISPTRFRRRFFKRRK